MLQQRIKNEDMGARWRGEGTQLMAKDSSTRVDGESAERGGVPVVSH
jgi:hypothetical protein